MSSVTGTAAQKGQAVHGEPSLWVSTTSIYHWIYNDKGSGGDHDGSVWFPIPPAGAILAGALGY